MYGKTIKGGMSTRHFLYQLQLFLHVGVSLFVKGNKVTFLALLRFYRNRYFLAYSCRVDKFVFATL